MKITDELERAAELLEALSAKATIECADNQTEIEDIARIGASALRAALATQPHRYREGFEKAREMAIQAAAEKARWLRDLWIKERQAKMLNEASGADMAASAIRNMEMPDE